MHKKLIMACLAIVAFGAFVVAPAASASPVLTDEGKALVAGTSFTGKSTGVFKFTASGSNLECSAFDLAGTLTENSGTSIKATIPVGGVVITGTGTGGDCTSSLGSTKWVFNSELCFATVKGTDNVSINGCGSNVTLTQEITGTGPCKYETASITGTYVTNAGATINISEQEVRGESTNGIFCPTAGKLDLDFDLYTTGGTTQLALS